MTKETVFFIALFFNYITTESGYKEEILTSNKKTNPIIPYTNNNKRNEEELLSILLANNEQIANNKQKEEKQEKEENTTREVIAHDQIIPAINQKKHLPDNDCWLFARLGSGYKYTSVHDRSSVKNVSFRTNSSTIATYFDVTPSKKNSSLIFEGYEK